MLAVLGQSSATGVWENQLSREAEDGQGSGPGGWQSTEQFGDRK